MARGIGRERIALLATAGLLGFVCGYRRPGDDDDEQFEYSVAVLRTPSPLDIPHGRGELRPVIRPEDIKRARAELVADPFLLRRDGTWYLFFELLNRTRRRGEIALATSADGRSWQYQGTVLRERFHLSYPYVFEHGGEVYMVPETAHAGQVRLYRAVAFPNSWRCEAVLMEGMHFTDPSLVYRDGRWWLFVSSHSEDLLLFSSEELQGPWIAHPQTPVVRQDTRTARCAGRIFEYKDHLLRLAQDCSRDYGANVQAMEITVLNERDYEEREYCPEPILAGCGGDGWNSGGMHHMDAHHLDSGEWLVAIDGWKRIGRFQ